MTDPILQNKEHFDRKVQEIRNYPDISTEAKRRYLSEPYAQAKQSMTRVVEEHKEEQRSIQIQDLERKVFKVSVPLSVSPHEKEIFRMSYRDAYDRTERVASSVEARQRTEALKNLLERAARSGDTQQADAVYHLAVERGLFDVADAYRETRLKTKERWETYAAARHEAESLASRLFGWVGPRKTHEFGDPLRGEGFSETG